MAELHIRDVGTTREQINNSNAAQHLLVSICSNFFPDLTVNGGKEGRNI